MNGRFSHVRRKASFLAFACCAALPFQVSAPAMPRTSAAPARFHYELAFVPGGGEGFPLQRRPEWRLGVRGEGLSAADGAVALVFNAWGGWQEVDSLYLDVVSCDPPIESGPFPGNAMVLSLPERWDGRFEVQLVIQPLRAGSKAQERWGMLPTWSPSYSFGQSRNVFPKVHQDHGPVAGRHTVALSAPKGCPIASGWNGLTAGRQQREIDPTEGNAFLSFGKPLAERTVKKSGKLLQVLQYGAARDVVETVSGIVQSLAASIGAATGRAVPDPMVVFLTDVGGGGMGADYGLVAGYRADTPDWMEHNAYFHHLLAHEFFHWWLGQQIRGSESFTWFHEGFTEYFSVWHLAATGVVSRAWFAERVHELGVEARDRSAWGSVAFADPTASWRDGDGPNETLAYKGGAMLAFALDVALRARGEPGSLQLIRDLLRRDHAEVSLDELHAWCLAHGLEDFWERHVAGTEILDFAGLLEQIGFTITQDADQFRFEATGRELDAFFAFSGDD